MGYSVEYSLVLRICFKDVQKALDIINEFDVYNKESEYKTLDKGLKGISLIEENIKIYCDKINEEYEIRGYYYDRYYEQKEILKKLAPVLKNTCFYVHGEDDDGFLWIINNHQFIEKKLGVIYEREYE